ncbi:hypothetical protein XA68_18076 [Ophiocordyceps unilateralis]|uniref:DUF1279 domain-containing protein n=1 Tax=Ophiocordyceps unilateralis TaxID=268505 RepID=A0A2A9P247_OPHUN|nr:hypothetical protein XA68_18076 [Ophiocordyceps unilateralis]
MFRLSAFPLARWRSRQSVAVQGVWRKLFSLETRMAANGSRQWQRSTMRHDAKRTRPTLYLQRRAFNLSPWRRTAGDGGKAPERLSLGARLKKLSKEYGWSAIGVYLALSVLDFPLCFLLVKIVGTEKIGKMEHYVVSTLSSIVPDSMRQRWREYRQAVADARQQQQPQQPGSDGGAAMVVTWGVQEAQRSNDEEASLATQLALAYAIHKSFIFIRVPLTAAVTPKVVKMLRSWGWNIGKRRR